jgi:hypothetical protein
MLDAGCSLRRIGDHYNKHPESIAYWVKKYGLSAVNKEKHASRGAIPEDELRLAVEAGLSIAELADAFERSKGTVRHWLRRYGLRTRHLVGRRMRDDLSAAKAAGLGTLAGRCPKHGDVEFVLEGRGGYRCKQCRIDAINRRRRKVKVLLVAEAGGKCCLCGYDRHPAALQFHHIDPSEKRLNVSTCNWGIETMRAEARKCVLLCGNCHAEVEHGCTQLPANVSGVGSAASSEHTRVSTGEKAQMVEP